MAAESSFDIVSKVDRQEVDNALNQAAKELAQRFDFRGTNASIAWAGEAGVTLQADTEERVAAALDVFKEKLIKRNISLKAFESGEPTISGKTYKVSGKILQGDQLRVSGKKKDDLQAVIALLKGRDFGIALQFTNYR